MRRAEIDASHSCSIVAVSFQQQAAVREGES